AGSGFRRTRASRRTGRRGRCPADVQCGLELPLKRQCNAVERTAPDFQSDPPLMLDLEQDAAEDATRAASLEIEGAVDRPAGTLFNAYHRVHGTGVEGDDAAHPRPEEGRDIRLGPFEIHLLPFAVIIHPVIGEL